MIFGCIFTAHLRASGENSDYSILRAQFVLGSRVLAIWGRFQLIFLHHKSWKCIVLLFPVYLLTDVNVCSTVLSTIHQMWSWYHHPLLLIVTWPCDLALTLDSGYTWQVTWSTTPPSLNILCLPILEIWVMTSQICNHWQCICSHCSCTVPRDLCVGGKCFPYIRNTWPWFIYSLCNLRGFMITINWVIHHTSIWPVF